MIELGKREMAKLRELLTGSASITLTTHVRQDGDALGSVTALLSFLKEVYHKEDVAAVLPGSCPDSLSFIIPDKYCNDFIFSGLDPEGAIGRIGVSDLVVCLDCSGFGRVEGLTEAYLDSKAVKVQIDHHLYPHTDQFDLMFSDPEQSSTCELLYHILMALPEVNGDASAIPIISAEALYTGMTTDTNNFANSVLPSTLGMASSLQAAGVNRERILGDLYHSYSEGRIRLLGYLLDRKLTITSKGAAYMVCTRKEMEDFGVGHEETEGFVNIPLAIKNVRISLFAKEDDGFFRISIRSKPGISARDLADSSFDGGGHELAAGGKVRPEAGMDPEEYVRLDVERKLEDFLE